MIPDWQLPRGVDRGLWDYMHSSEMVANYDAQMAVSPLAQTDIAFCESAFVMPGKLLDLGCGTGRLIAHFAPRGFECVGVDLSEEMLKVAAARAENAEAKFIHANLLELEKHVSVGFDYAACLFSTLGMIRGKSERDEVLQAVHRILKPGGSFVLHAHNRWFHELGWKRFRSADLTMRQAYGGAPLTLHHFTRSELRRVLKKSGFRIQKWLPLRVLNTEPLPYAWWLPSVRAYGYLVLATKEAK